MKVPVVLQYIDRAYQMVVGLCERRHEWIMSIPARPDKDPDLIIGEGLRTARFALLELHTLRPVADYHEDFGDVLWWHLPLQESPIVGGGPGAGEYYRNNGGPTACQRLHDEGWLTHWTPLPTPIEPEVKS